MLLPHAGRAGVQRWDQGSLLTFALTGAVQPLTCCTAEFPPLGCTDRKLLSANGSSLLFPLRALGWEERGGGNMPNQEGIIQTPHFAAVPHQHRLQKNFTGHPQPVCGWRESERQENQLLPSSPTPPRDQHSPPSPGVVFGKGGGDAQWGLISLCLWMVSELPAAGPVQKCQVMPLHGDFP